jgi:hypothetical protein
MPSRAQQLAAAALVVTVGLAVTCRVASVTRCAPRRRSFATCGPAPDNSAHVLLARGTGIVLKGLGLDYLWPNLLPLRAFGAVVFTLAVLRFRKQLD